MNSKIIAAVLIFTTVVSAHEYWIEPSRFHADRKEKIDVALRVGEHFKGEPSPRKNERIKVFSYFGPGREEPTPIAGEEGRDPAGQIELSGEGLYVLGFHNTPSRIELEPEKFNDYLRGDGLEHIIDLRKEFGEADKAGRELYSRCAKALILAGPPVDAGWDRRFGFPLELVPRSNPFSLSPDQPMVFALLYQGKPLSGVKVMAMRRGAAEKVVSARTDQDGLVRLPVDEPGVWLVAGVHMIRLEGSAEADWHSFWASLTFEVPGRK